MDPLKTVRLGIIGVGNMGRAHAQNILDKKIPGMELTALCDIDPACAKHYPDVPFFNEAKSLLASGSVDAVLISTPHYDHTTIGIDALNAGLHVLVEKPISVHKADCERLIAAHKNPKQIFAAMFNQRTDPRYRKLKSLIDSGEIGAINRINWIITDWFRTETYYSSGGWRATWAGEGGGVLLNQCPHQLDLWQWLFGSPYKVRSFCKTGRFHEIEVEDDVTTYMDYADGKTGVFITTTGEAPGTNRLEIAAERGRLIVEGNSIKWTRNEMPTAEFCKTSKGSFSRPDTWEITIPFNDYGEQHNGILKNFAKAILEGEPLIARAEEGIRSVELANAMIFSSNKDATIEFPLDAAAYESFIKEKIATSSFVKKVVAPAATSSDFANSYKA